jgi:hypothetical protein
MTLKRGHNPDTFEADLERARLGVAPESDQNNVDAPPDPDRESMADRIRRWYYDIVFGKVPPDRPTRR